MAVDAHALIRLLNLKPLVGEGGFFCETYRSEDAVAVSPTRYGPGARSISTAIYYMLTADTFSALHKLPTDEIYHFYLGDRVEMLQLFEGGRGAVIDIGSDLEAGVRPQVTVPAGTWQGCRLVEGGQFALMGTTMAPGFEFADFKAGDRAALCARFPNYADRIARLTRS